VEDAVRAASERSLDDLEEEVGRAVARLVNARKKLTRNFILQKKRKERREQNEARTLWGNVFYSSLMAL
jgi:(p)ppGpp synthase/HD superfamily hydrolase